MENLDLSQLVEIGQSIYKEGIPQDLDLSQLLAFGKSLYKEGKIPSIIQAIFETPEQKELREEKEKEQLAKALMEAQQAAYLYSEDNWKAPW